MAPQAVVLDLDGTVWDSRPWYAAVAGRGDAGQAGRALAQLEAGRPAAKVLREAGYSYAGFSSVCRSGQPPLTCSTGLLEALCVLRDRGVELAAATNLPAWMAMPMADACGIAPLLETIVDWGATTRHKPHPDPLLEAAARLELDPRLAWYVGDEASDAAAAEAAGMPFAWAAWGTETSPPESASVTLERPGDLADLPWPPGTAAVAW
jgi:phosphoglycolate phosphatase-like HAD superfamily hydrolase